jgi:hypothetical protein
VRLFNKAAMSGRQLQGKGTGDKNPLCRQLGGAMDYLIQIAAAAALLAVYYMYEYWYVTLFVVFLGVVGMIASSGKSGSR